MNTCSNRHWGRYVGRLCCACARISLVLTLVLGAAGTLAMAQVAPGRFLTISERVSFPGDVQSVYLLVTGKHGLLHSGPASWIQSTQAEEIACVGRFSVSPEEEIHGVLFVVFGTKSEVRSVFRSLSTSEIAPASYLSIDELRERLVERRSMLRQLDGEVRLQEERIETLQEDADAIANVAKIVNVEDELEDVKRKIQALDMAAKDIQQRKSQMKSRPAPLNAQTREAELVKQLAELSTALSATETSALQRISSASGELQGKLQLIEDTREDHVTLLEEELAELQRRRKR